MPASSDTPDLKEPEWRVFTQFDPDLNGEDFQLKPVKMPARYTDHFSQVVLVERMREVYNDP